MKIRKLKTRKFIYVLFHRNFKLYFFSYFLIFLGITLILLSFGSTIYSEYHFYLDKISRTKYVLEDTGLSKNKSNNIFDDLINGQEISLKPPSPNSIIIEKIGVAAPIIWDVSVVEEEEYFNALKKGVAHAKGKSYPGQAGNVYLFAHSSIEFWKMGPYATVFNQVRRLEMGDKIYVFYKGKRYDYIVDSKTVVNGFDLSPYSANYEDSVLTLQTCDPPGTQLNRLIVTAKLVGSR